MSTYNLCFGAKIRKSVYPCLPQFCNITFGYNGAYFTRTCFLDASGTFRKPNERVPYRWPLPDLNSIYENVHKVQTAQKFNTLE